MKKTDWTDRMLGALVKLYPVETTAYTAAVLNLSESTVKLKARELGLILIAHYGIIGTILACTITDLYNQSRGFIKK